MSPTFPTNRSDLKRGERVQPKVHVYAAVDASGESYERLRAAGLAVQIPDEPWSQAGNRSGDSVELIFDPSTVAGGRGRQPAQRSHPPLAGIGARTPPDRQVFRRLRQCRRGGGDRTRRPRRQQPDRKQLGRCRRRGRRLHPGVAQEGARARSQRKGGSLARPVADGHLSRRAAYRRLSRHRRRHRGARTHRLARRRPARALARPTDGLRPLCRGGAVREPQTSAAWISTNCCPRPMW